MTLTVAVGAAAGGGVTNTATVSTPGDANFANNSASDLTSVNCQPRPRLQVAAVRAGNGQLNVTLTSTAAPMQQVRFQVSSGRGARNAAVDVPRDPTIPSLAGGGLSNQTADFALQIGGPRLSFTVRRLAAGSFSVPLVVTDACGDWPTFVGAGS